MNIGLFTLDSRIYNYGGILQEYALLKVLDRYGNAEIIDYDLNSELNTFSVKRSILNLDAKKLYSYLKKIYSRYHKRDADNKNVIDSVNLRKSAFDHFRNKYMNFSDRMNVENLSYHSTKYDYIVCGSDQVWNPDYNKPSFFLDFTDRKKRIIYAASVGKNKLCNREKKMFQRYLDGIDNISLREHEAKSLFDKEYQSKAKIVLDPTMLLSDTEWEQIESTELDYKDYIFCYFLSHTAEKIQAARDFAIKHNKKIVAIPYLHGVEEHDTFTYADFILSNVGPQEFIALIHRSDCVLTDSFHACVFSLLFNKCFYVFGRSVGKQNMNGRIITLLSYYKDASNRMIDPCELMSKTIEHVVYNKESLNNKISDSLEYITNSLGYGDRRI